MFPLLKLSWYLFEIKFVFFPSIITNNQKILITPFFRKLSHFLTNNSILSNQALNLDLKKCINSFIRYNYEKHRDYLAYLFILKFLKLKNKSNLT